MSNIQQPKIEKKKQIAKKRWMFLINSLVKKRQVGEVNDSVSVRRFSSFGLLQMRGVDVDKEANKCHRWYEYSSKYIPDFAVDIRLLDGSFDVKDLFGFNNTGNVCVWPAEEVLTYHCLQNLSKFDNKSICELGGGMTCLAGITVAACSNARKIVLTDGNEKSVENVNVIVKRNKAKIGNTDASGRVLLWKEHGNLGDLEGAFDCVICADCLFFDGCREDLSLTIYKLLKPKGVAILFAPSRGTTLQQFVTLAKTHFEVERHDKYDDLTWKLHHENLAKGIDVYDPNLHYPILLTLNKSEEPL